MPSAASRPRRPSLIGLLTGLMVAVPCTLHAQQPQPLPLGRLVTGTLGGDATTDYRLTLESAGLLSVASDGTGDVVLQLLDRDGQPVANGRSDEDLDGVGARELLSVRIGEAGPYILRVASVGGDPATFQLGATLLGFPAWAKAADPDGRPSGARALTPGTPVEDALDPAHGDERDWFTVRATADGTLVFATRGLGAGDGFDLVLEAYLDGRFDEAVQRSDQDLQDDMANEAVTVVVRAGQVVHVRVSALSSQGGRYRLSSTLMD
jgi:hypothetical protein